MRYMFAFFMVVHSQPAGLRHAWAQYFLALLMIDRIDNGFCSQGPLYHMLPIKRIFLNKSTVKQQK